MAQRFYSTTYYAVKCGHKPGIYTNYGEVLDQIDDFDKAVWRKFTNRADAEAFLRGPDEAAESYERLLQKYLDGDTSVLPRLEKLAQAMNGKANGNSASSATHSRLGLDSRSARTRNAGYGRRGTVRVR